MALISPSLELNFSNPKIPKLSNPNPTVNLLCPLILSLPSKTPTNYQLCPWETLISTSRNYRNLTAFSSLRFLVSDEDVGSSPWEGAVIYRRDSAVTHLEYCTTLERLGLEKLSSDLSRSRALDMGLRVTKGVKDYPHGTPVLISTEKEEIEARRNYQERNYPQLQQVRGASNRVHFLQLHVSANRRTYRRTR